MNFKPGPSKSRQTLKLQLFGRLKPIEIEVKHIPVVRLVRLKQRIGRLLLRAVFHQAHIPRTSVVLPAPKSPCK